MKSIPYNPYIVGNPIKSKGMFFGREDDFQFVAKKIGEGRSNQILVLSGERRSGKTSILFQIMGGRLGPIFLPVLIDMQMFAGIKGDLEFFRSILKAGAAALNLPGLDTEGLEGRGGEAGIEKFFESFLLSIREKAPDKIILFLLDEYELIETKIKDGSLSESSIHYLAGILESPYRVSFIFTGSANLEDRKVDMWKSLLGKSVYRKISYLSRNDTARLITEPLRESVQYPHILVDSIYRLTGGQPFYTQVICQNMVDLLIEKQKSDPGIEDLEHIVREIVDNPLPQMIYSWNSVNEWDQIILASLAGRLADPEEWSEAQEIARFIRDNRIILPFKKERVNVLLEEGYHKDFLEKNDERSYRFKMDLFRRWIRREHSIWKAAKEAGLEFQKGIPRAVWIVALVVALAAGGLFLISRYIPGFASRFGGSAAKKAEESAATSIEQKERQVKEIAFEANRGPFRLRIDGGQTLTSEGQSNPLSIVVPSLEAGPHDVIASLPGGEKVSVKLDVAMDGQTFSVSFPAPKLKTVQTGTTENKTEPGAQSGSNAEGPAENAFAEAQVEEEQAMGVLVVNTQPPGAEVSIDGRPTGKKTPYAESMTSGAHNIVLGLDGYRSHEFTIEVEGSGQTKQEVSLEEAWAWITLDVRPTAKISLDGKYILDTPYAKPYKVQAGAHTLTIVNEALGVNKSLSLELKEGETTRIQEVLK